MSKRPHIKMKFFKQIPLSAQESVLLPAAEALIPLENNLFPLHELLRRTQGGKEWFTQYQQYYANLFQSRSFAPEGLYATTTPLNVRNLCYAVHEMNVMSFMQTSHEENTESRARIKFLDPNLAAFLNMTFTSRKSNHPGDLLNFPSLEQYVRDATGDVQAYYTFTRGTFRKQKTMEGLLLGTLQQRNLKRGWSFVDGVSGLLKGYSAFKFEPPLYHEVQLSIPRMYGNWISESDLILKVSLEVMES